MSQEDQRKLGKTHKRIRKQSHKNCATFQQPSLCLEEKAPPDVQQAFQESRTNRASQADDIVESLYHDACLTQSSDRFHKAALIRVPGSDHPHQGTKFLAGRLLDAERCYLRMRMYQDTAKGLHFGPATPHSKSMLPSTLLTQHICMGLHASILSQASQAGHRPHFFQVAGEESRSLAEIRVARTSWCFCVSVSVR